MFCWFEAKYLCSTSSTGSTSGGTGSGTSGTTHSGGTTSSLGGGSGGTSGLGGGRTTGSRGVPDSFRVSFRGKSPEKITAVANTLASYFIDENLKVRDEQATGTSDFLEGELVVMRGKLEKVEEWRVKLPQTEAVEK